MTHKGIIDNFTSDRFSGLWLSRAIESEIFRLNFNTKACYRDVDPKTHLKNILNELMPRWNHLLHSSNFELEYKERTYLIIATYLHKLGYQDDFLTNKAITYLKKINTSKLSSTNSIKKSALAIELLGQKPVFKENYKPIKDYEFSQFRTGDILSIKVKDKFIPLLIRDRELIYGTPRVSIYNKVFNSKPNLADLTNVPLKGYYYISEMTFLPDLANQITFIANIGSEEEEFKPTTVCDIYSFIREIESIFSIKN